MQNKLSIKSITEYQMGKQNNSINSENGTDMKKAWTKEEDRLLFSGFYEIKANQDKWEMISKNYVKTRTTDECYGRYEEILRLEKMREFFESKYSEQQTMNTNQHSHNHNHNHNHHQHSHHLNPNIHQSYSQPQSGFLVQRDQIPMNYRQQQYLPYQETHIGYPHLNYKYPPLSMPSFYGVQQQSQFYSDPNIYKKGYQVISGKNANAKDAQFECCIRDCVTSVENRLRFSLRGEYGFKKGFLEKNWNKVCNKCYFADLYRHKIGKKRKEKKRKEKEAREREAREREAKEKETSED